MYLSRLEIQGFKSFANNTKLDFQRGITAIVGPNGSGKSNVADAIRWVLGEQSLKVLRGKRSDDVIFAGSDKKSRLGVAEVSLYLNNEDKGAPIDYTEFVITRRVYRDGEGEYLINRQPARLQDIQLLLAQANFGQRTYSVIAQGMIDSFLTSSPQDRKHLFDEAAGVRQYQLKKDQALNKLYQTKENLAQGEAIMQEIEPRLRSLTRQVKRLERREMVETDLRAKQRLFFGLRWQELQAELAAETTRQATAQSKHDAIAQELGVIQSELDAIERERSSSEIFIGLQKTYNTILDEKNRLLQEQAVIKGKLELAGKTSGQSSAYDYEQRVDQLKRNLERLNDDCELTAQELKRAQGAYQRAADELKTIDLEFAALEQKIAAIKQRWESSFTWPQAQAAVSSFFEKYHEFVELLHEQDDLDATVVRAQAAKLRDELESLVKRLETGDDAANPQSLMDMQQQAVDAAKQRQTALTTVMQRQAEVQMIEHRRGMQAEEYDRVAAELKQAEEQSKLEALAIAHPDQAHSAYTKEAKRVAAAVADADARLLEARSKMNDFTSTESAKKERLFSLQKSFRDTQQHLNHAAHEVNELQIKLARLEQRRDDLHREMVQAMDETAANEVMKAKDQLDGDITLLAEEIGHLSHQLQLIGGIDEQTTQEYQDTNERWEFLNKQAEDLRAGIFQLEGAIAELDGTIKKKFDTAFKKINEEFNQYFRTLFRGGKAELTLIQEVPLPPKQVKAADDDDESDDDEDEVEVPAPKGEKVIVGIDIKATPPGKKLQGIAMLSGGERALTSIALLCAIISNNPSPFVTLDEVDAALDEANSQRFAAILDHLAKKSQFITITHNRATMEKAALLYGVTMGDDGVSQLLSVHMDEAEKIIQQHGNR